MFEFLASPIADPINAVADANQNLADSLFSLGEGQAACGQGFFQGMIGVGQGGLIALALLLLLVLLISFSMRSFSKSRNNPAALQRLQMMHDFKLKREAIRSGANEMHHFD